MQIHWWIFSLPYFYKKYLKGKKVPIKKTDCVDLNCLLRNSLYAFVYNPVSGLLKYLRLKKKKKQHW